MAKEIVDGLDSSGSETAANILFMRVKMWEIFREHAEILVPERIRKLSRIPLPSEIRRGDWKQEEVSAVGTRPLKAAEQCFYLEIY